MKTLSIHAVVINAPSEKWPANREAVAFEDDTVPPAKRMAKCHRQRILGKAHGMIEPGHVGAGRSALT